LKVCFSFFNKTTALVEPSRDQSLIKMYIVNNSGS
jgi:hypothetical protein